MARLDFTAGNILLATEMDELARQATSNVTAASKPSATAEGETIAVTDNDRLNHWDGAAWQRGANWSAAGRTWVTKTLNTGSVGDGTVPELSWTGGTDADGFYTGWTGSVYNFTVPAGLGGLYVISCRIQWVDAWTTDPQDRMRFTLPGTPIDFIQTGVGANYIATLVYPLSAAATVSVQLTQNSGLTNDMDNGDFTMVRLCV
jgi:hypothetical protein